MTVLKENGTDYFCTNLLVTTGWCHAEAHSVIAVYTFWRRAGKHICVAMKQTRLLYTVAVWVEWSQSETFVTECLKNKIVPSIMIPYLYSGVESALDVYCFLNETPLYTSQDVLGFYPLHEDCYRFKSDWGTYCLFLR